MPNQHETTGMFNYTSYSGPTEAFVKHVFATGLPWPSKPLSKKTGHSGGMKSERPMRHPRTGKKKNY